MSNSEMEEKSIGELTSLYGMLTCADRSRRFDQILIPKIQRDYAQGRTGKEIMRERFLKRLFGAVDREESPGIKLDFVYGQAKDGVFLPIDGQQRLTTLMLLHLYLGKRADMDVSVLQNFTYDTRDSSKEFCRKLIEIPGEKFKGIKRYIEDQWWFTNRWSSDPTIASMLVMLNDIDLHYKDIGQSEIKVIWDRLTELNRIEFWNLKLDDLRTSDDLYIKMNSRGKPLTSFEHFKAEIESYLHTPDDEEQKKKASVFSLKIDTVWTNLLWDYRDKNADSCADTYIDNGLDGMFINIFKHFMVMEGVKLGMPYKELENTYILSLAEKILKGRAGLLLNRFTHIMDFFASLPDVKSLFDNIFTHICDECRIKDNVKASSQNYRVYLQQNLEGTRDFFCRAIKSSKLDLAEMLMLEAFFNYADRNVEDGVGDIDSLREKIRVIRNLIVNSKDELRAERMPALLRRVDEIMDGKPMDESASGEFRQAQVVQENRKIDFCRTHPEEEWVVKFAENHSLLCGNLVCYMSDEDGLQTDFLRKHEQLFHADADYDNIQRFLLAYGDYAPYVRGRKLYGGRHWENWRDDIFTNKNKVTTPILHKALGECAVFDNGTLNAVIDEYVDSCVSNSTFTWRYYLIKHKGARHGDWARYATASDFITYDFVMMNKNNFNGKHWNPYLYCLSQKFKNRGAKLEEYNAPLVFEKEEITVYGNESDFDLIMKDGSHRRLQIPQSEKDGMKVDEVDRIDWAFDEISKILDSTESETD